MKKSHLNLVFFANLTLFAWRDRHGAQGEPTRQRDRGSDPLVLKE